MEKKHNYGSFDYKTINKNIKNILDARSQLNNTVQMGMPFVKATTTMKHPEYLGTDNIGFTLGLHGIDKDVAYESMYSSIDGTYPLIGYTYTADGQTELLYAKNPYDQIQTNVGQVFDKNAALVTYPKDSKFIRIPPPGITNVTVGRANNGLLESAQIQINVPSLIQMEMLHRVFLVPGMGMVLEWGQQFAPYDISNPAVVQELLSGDDPYAQRINTNQLSQLSDITKYMFPWNNRTELLKMLEKLAKRETGLLDILEKYVYPSNGQYMWMFGRVANFTIKSNSDGSFNVSVKIVGPSEDSWAYDTRNTVVPRKDPSSEFFCASDTHSVYSYFHNTTTGLNLKTLLDATQSDARLKQWSSHVIKFEKGNQVTEGEPKPGTQTATVDEKGFADSEDAYFMTWRFFVNVVINDEQYGIKAVFKNAGIDSKKLATIGLLLPYADGDLRNNTNVAGIKGIDDPKESFVGMNKYLRSIDPSALIIVNEMAAELAAKNPQYNIPSIETKLLEKTPEVSKFLAPTNRFETSAVIPNTDYVKDSSNPDRGFLSSGVWLNHKAVVESMLSGDTILRGVTMLLERMNAATRNYWQLTLDAIEGDDKLPNAHSYVVVDANFRESSEKAVANFIDNVHIFNKYIRTTPDGPLVGSEIIECSIDLSLPKRLFTQIATLGLLTKEQVAASSTPASGSTGEDPSTLKISDPNDALLKMFSITSLSEKIEGNQGPDLTILPIDPTQAKTGVCGQASTQTVAGTTGQGHDGGKLNLKDLPKNKDDVKKLYDSTKKALESDECKKCEQCIQGGTVTTTPTTVKNASNTPTNTLPSNTQAFINNTPWSAGFISYVMNSAKVPFPAAGAHTAYAQSVRKGFSGWQALDPRTTRVQPGDVIVQNRSNNTLSYSTGTWSGASHGDVVTEVSSGKVTAVGGNVSDRVKASVFNLNANGTLQSSNFFTILRPPASSVNNITTAANIELNKWSSNSWKESTPAAFDSLNTYYVAGKLVKPDTLTPPKTTTNPSLFTPIQSVSEPGIETAAADFIAKEEGLPRGGKAYYDPPLKKQQAKGTDPSAYTVSIGYGHQITSTEYRQGYIQIGNEQIPLAGQRGVDTRLTQEQAKKLLAKDIPSYISRAKTPVGNDAWNKLNLNQKVVLVSYAYNVGSTRNLVRAGLTDSILKNDFNTAATIIKDKGTVTSAGTVDPGLVRRRNKESQAFGQASSQQPVQAPPTKSPTPITGTCAEIFKEVGEEKCKECKKHKETLRQLDEVNTAQQSVEDALRKFPNLRQVFRYVEVFPELMVASIAGDADGDKSNAFGASPGTLSIAGDLVMPGINGLRIGELFWIDRIPAFYKAFGAFQIFGIEDTIGVDGWKTKIRARFNYLGNKWKEAMFLKLKN